MKLPYLLLGAALVLSACNQEKAKPTGGTADGEILPGSISDAMLPLDTVRSQPPLAPRVEGSGRPTEKSAPNGGIVRTRAAEGADTPAVTAAPASEPAAKPADDE